MDDKPMRAQYLHADSDARMATLLEVAKEVDATPIQVIFAWMTGRGVIDISGAS